jgi:hypothetical protein
MIGLVSALVARPLPVGRFVGELTGSPSGTLGAPTEHATLQGNGYMGVTLSTNKPPVPLQSNGSSLELWINSNGNWDCAPSGKALPPAVCSTRMLGVVSLAVRAPAFAPELTSVLTEQRVANGTLLSSRTSHDGSLTLEVSTYVHHDTNVLVIDATLTARDEAKRGPAQQHGHTASDEDARGAAAPPPLLEATLASFGPNRHTSSPVASCTLNAPTSATSRWYAACSRRYHKLTPPPTLPHVPWSALAMTTPHGARAPLTTVRGNGTYSGYEKEYVTASFGTAANTATRVTLLVALTDNLLIDSAAHDDPTPAAVAAATTADAHAIAVANAASWDAYWGTSSVTLPTRPALADMWAGSLYATAAAFPSAKLVHASAGRAPPPGLYGPWTTVDFAFCTPPTAIRTPVFSPPLL